MHRFPALVALVAIVTLAMALSTGATVMPRMTNRLSLTRSLTRWKNQLAHLFRGKLHMELHLPDARVSSGP